jgi:hypothetical protein
VYAKAFEKPDYQEAIVAFNLMQEYKVNKVFVDGLLLRILLAN